MKATPDCIVLTPTSYARVPLNKKIGDDDIPGEEDSDDDGAPGLEALYGGDIQVRRFPDSRYRNMEPSVFEAV